MYYQKNNEGNYDFYDPSTNTAYDGPRNEFLDNTKIALGFLINNGLGRELLAIAKDQTENVDIKESHVLEFMGFSKQEKTIYFNPFSALKTQDGERTFPAFDLYHEFGHAYEFVKHRAAYDARNTPNGDAEEKYDMENYKHPGAEKLGNRGIMVPIRTYGTSNLF